MAPVEEPGGNLQGSINVFGTEANRLSGSFSKDDRVIDKYYTFSQLGAQPYSNQALYTFGRAKIFVRGDKTFNEHFDINIYHCFAGSLL